jgi:hypothetical protein
MKRWRWALSAIVGATAIVVACTGEDPPFNEVHDAGTSSSSSSSSSGAPSNDAGVYVPFKVKADAVLLEPGEKTTLPFVIERDPGFAEELDIAIDNAPPGVGLSSAVDGGGMLIGADVATPSDKLTEATLRVTSKGTHLVATAKLYIRIGHFLFSADTSTIWTVPPDVKVVQVAAWGGGGGGGAGATGQGGGSGGGGGWVLATVDVTPGEWLALVIGAGGAGGDSLPNDKSFGSGGMGGGFTSVLRPRFGVADAGGALIEDFIVIAGGGGGGGGASSAQAGSKGGGGGGIPGGDGVGSLTAGKGGTEVAGGAGSDDAGTEARGSLFRGGDAPVNCALNKDPKPVPGEPGGGHGSFCGRGGGGGGGHYGGGAGYALGDTLGTAGGGGSAYWIATARDAGAKSASFAAPPAATYPHFSAGRAAGGNPGPAQQPGAGGIPGQIVLMIPGWK